MRIGPRRSSGCLLIDKCHFQLGRSQRKQLAQQGQRFLFMAGLHFQFNILFLLEKLEFLPGLHNQVPKLIGCLFIDCIISVKRNECQKGISLRDLQFAASLRVILGDKAGIQGAEFQQFVLCPHLSPLFSRRFHQLCEASFLGKPDIVNRGILIKIHKFIVNLIFFLFGTLRNNAGHIARNGDSAEVLHDADTLIALLHIEFIHIFISFNGVTDALVLLALTEIDPLGRELRIFIENRHKIARKRTAPPHCLGPYDLRYGYLHQTQRHLMISAFLRHDIIQYLQGWLYPPKHPGLIILFS